VADSLGLTTILRSALARLSDESTGPPDDPAILSFKQRILRSVAQLEIERNSLRAPDVIVPETEAAVPAQRVPLQTEAQTAAHNKPSEASAASPDTVTVLVARRPRKPRDKDSGSSGHSSAA